MKIKSIKEILSPNIISVSPETATAEAISIMKTNKISCILVIQDKKPVGIFTERDVIRLVQQDVSFDTVKINELMSAPVITTKDDIDILEAYNIILTGEIRHLAIVDAKGEAIGVVTQTDIISSLGPDYFVVFNKISKMMTKVVVTVDTGQTVKDTIIKMAGNYISCIVVDDNRHPVGILTERDVIRLLHEKAKLEELKIGDVMSSPVCTINKDAQIHDAVRTMNQKNIRRLIVVNEDGKLEGMLTQYDVIKGLEPEYIKYLKSTLHEKSKVLEEKTVYLDNILRSATEYAIATTTPDFRITYYNPMAEKIFGHKAEDVIGKTVQEIHTKENVSHERFERAIENIKRSGEHLYTVEKKTNEGIRYIHSRVSGIYDSSNNMVGYALFSKDITERKQAEDNLKKSYQDIKASQKASLDIMKDLEKSQKELDHSLKEKDMLLREVHHRVKNNMQVVSSLLRLQSRHVKDKQYVEMFEESRSRVMAMALVHEKLYLSKDLANVDFKDYIKSLANDLFRSYNVDTSKVSMKMDVDSVSLGIEIAIPCGLAINELVTNSLKHAFPENKKGEIKITLHKTEIAAPESVAPEATHHDRNAQTQNPESEIELIISDNGIGIPDNIDYRNTDSLGLRLATNLAEHQLQGKVELNRGNGTEFRIRFKDAKYKERM